jgi:hypothetical protein
MNAIDKYESFHDWYLIGAEVDEAQRRGKSIVSIEARLGAELLVECDDVEVIPLNPSAG